MLGPLEVLVDGRPVKLGGPRERGALVLLLAQANTVVSASRLVDALWDDEPPPTAANLVQGHVSHLRRGIGKEAIEKRGGGYALGVDEGALDLHRFERLAQAGSAALANGSPDEAARALRDALSLWSGSALADLTGPASLDALAGRLEELRVLATESLLEAELALGRHADVVAEIDSPVPPR